MITELFLPTKGGTAVSFDDDFRRLGGKEIHVVTADVPGAAEFDRTQPNTIHRVALKRVPWLKPESLLIYWKLLVKAASLAARYRFIAIFAGRVLPEGLVAWTIARLRGRPVLIYAHGEELTNWGRGRKFALMRFVFRRADAVLANSDFTRDTLAGLLGVDPGRIAVVYLLRKSGSYRATVAISTNGGTTWKGNKSIASASSTFGNCLSGGGSPFMGDYIGAAWAGNTLHATWPDDRTGTCQDEWGGVSF